MAKKKEPEVLDEIVVAGIRLLVKRSLGCKGCVFNNVDIAGVRSQACINMSSIKSCQGGLIFTAADDSIDQTTIIEVVTAISTIESIHS